MDRFFNQAPLPSFWSEEMPEVDWSPRIDIIENNHNFIVKAELAGLNKDDVKITLQDNILTLKGEKKEEKERKDANYRICERRYGKFIRSFRLPSTVNSKKIDASFKDGILSLTLPKTEEARLQEIEIKAD
jgi:HSP20 family protein